MYKLANNFNYAEDNSASSEAVVDTRNEAENRTRVSASAKENHQPETAQNPSKKFQNPPKKSQNPPKKSQKPKRKRMHIAHHPSCKFSSKKSFHTRIFWLLWQWWWFWRGIWIWKRKRKSFKHCRAASENWWDEKFRCWSRSWRTNERILFLRQWSVKLTATDCLTLHEVCRKIYTFCLQKRWLW